MSRTSILDRPPSNAAHATERLYQMARRQLMVNEPLCTHRDSPAAFSAGEVAALQEAGLSVAPWQGPADADPVVQSIADYMALLETSFSTQEVADYLQVDASRIRQRLRERSLFGIDYDGERRLPRFQFERRKVLPGLKSVLTALPADLNPLDVAQWFLAPNPDLELSAEHEPLSPRQWLLRGEPVSVVATLAKGFE